ncbi:hypothetical protein BpHYR1_027545 [Brachionus plicatilis]|uniref:Uncharacterized protein n=1 Tax=Brachionus plicatilis TaxID=10195 RepID=A0A3M7SNZ0_BRAPC|nr:hypothetical protein BpHYR1_027545 [Brachionus plicatilis]
MRRIRNRVSQFSTSRSYPKCIKFLKFAYCNVGKIIPIKFPNILVSFELQDFLTYKSIFSSSKVRLRFLEFSDD